MRVLGGDYQKIVYDSVSNSIAITKILVSSTLAWSEGKGRIKSIQSQYQTQTHSSKKISNSQKEQLLQTIMSNEFFQTEIFYPPDPIGTQDYLLVILAIELGDKTHSTIWAETSREVPAGLISIVKAIQEIFF